MTDADAEARWGACRALAEFRERAAPAIPALLTALKDGDAEVRGMAAIALARIDPEDVPRRQILMPVLIQNLERVPGSQWQYLQSSTIEVISAWGE